MVDNMELCLEPIVLHFKDMKTNSAINCENLRN